MLRTTFTVARWDAAQNAYVDLPAAGGSQSSVANGGIAQVRVPIALTQGGIYSFRAQSSDGTDTGALSGSCEFQVDAVAPDKAPVVTSTDGRYLADDGTHGWHDGVGKTGIFRFDSNAISDGGVNDVVAYRYDTVEPPLTQLAAPAMGESVSINVTPSRPGLMTLYVRSVDRAGNLSPVRKYRFFVGSGAAPVGMWKLSDGSGSTATDTGGGQHPGVMSSGTGWSVDGRLVGSGAATFNGVDGAIEAGAPVIRTDQSFAVAAWVRPNAADSNFHTVVSIDGVNTSAFYLQYRKDTQRWAFTLAPQDTGDRVTVLANAPATPAPGAWNHLAAVYDGTNHLAKLYVNGTLVSSVSFTFNWSPTGTLTIGRGKYYGAPADWWAGDIAEVRVWDRLVYDDEVTELAAPMLVGAWDLDERAGQLTEDTTVFGHHGTLQGGASWTIPGHRSDDLAAVDFNATDAAIQTDAPVLRTDQSFTVSTWARLTENTNFRTAVSQDGSASSAFYLQYRKDSGKWSLTMRNADTNGASSVVVDSTSTATLNQWTHLVGVFDAQARTATLYVNGVAQKTKSFTTPWHANGPLLIGRGRSYSGNCDWFAGSIDDVRVYQGALPASAVATLANS
jgi:hypothetical protein